MLRRILLTLSSTSLLLLLVGCPSDRLEVIREIDEKQYQLGQDYKAQGRIDEALGAFLRVVEARRDAPESHFEAGYIYLSELKDPIRSIYHFDRYLQLKPQSPQASQVRQLIETARKEFARQLPGQPFAGQLDRIDLMDLVENLRLENDSLKKDLLVAETKLRSIDPSSVRLPSTSSAAQQRRSTRQQLPAISTEPLSRPVSNRPDAQASESQRRPANPSTQLTVPDTYVVQTGDSLSSISRQVYGTPSRWIDIFQANRDRLSSENALTVGQTIRIP